MYITMYNLFPELKPYSSGPMRISRYLHGGGQVLQISSDGDDRRIFLGLKCLISGFFGVGKFGEYFFFFRGGGEGGGGA